MYAPAALGHLEIVLLFAFVVSLPVLTAARVADIPLPSPRRRVRFAIVDVPLFGVLPLLTFYFGLGENFGSLSRDGFIDFHPIWLAGQRIVHHLPLYSSTIGQRPKPGIDYSYPAPGALVFSPLGTVSLRTAAIIFSAGAIAALLLALWLLGVRDWRCYGAALALRPTEEAIAVGTVTSFLLLGAAIAWRYRDTQWRSGLATACSVVLKVYMWPLLAWFVATRRLRAAAAAAAIAIASCAVTAAVLGVHVFVEYPSIARALARVFGPASYSFAGGLGLLGLGWGVADAAALIVALALITCAGVAARRGTLPESESFMLAMLAALVASPILWLHYLTLLLVPIALAAPRLSPLWLCLSITWFVQVPPRNGGSLGSVAFVWALIGIVFLAAMPILRRGIVSRLRLHTAFEPRRWALNLAGIGRDHE